MTPEVRKEVSDALLDYWGAELDDKRTVGKKRETILDKIDSIIATEVEKEREACAKLCAPFDVLSLRTSIALAHFPATRSLSLAGRWPRCSTTIQGRAMTDDKLPPLPDPLTYDLNGSGNDAELFDGRQMHAYALAAVELARPKWTTERPTVEGWYWSRHVEGKILPGVVKITKEYNGQLWAGVCPVSSHIGWQWSGLLPEPLEPQP